MGLKTMCIAIAATSALLQSSAGFAARITFTPMMGYHHMGWANDQQRDALRTGMVTNPSTKLANGGVALDNDIEEAYALGLGLTPYVDFELEYGQTQTKAFANHQANAPQFDARQKLLNGNFLFSTDYLTGAMSEKLKPYVLVGAGQSTINVKRETTRLLSAESKDTVGNLGFGALYHVNPYAALRTEVRAVHNFDHNWWEGMALVGVQLAWHSQQTPLTSTIVPVVERDLDAEKAAVKAAVVEKVADPVVVKVLDSDADGVVDTLDQCPNTPVGVTVDDKGCPKVQPASMEMRIYFDTNRAEIKPRFNPEVEKAAQALIASPTSKMTIEGHTDNTGSLALNQRLSLKRANSVKSALVRKYGVSNNRLTTQGFADTRPIASNETAEGRAVNRRVYAVVADK